MTNGHKRKKMTKKEAMDSVSKSVKENLQSNYIKNIVQGFEIANKMLAEYMETHTFEESKEFVNKNLKRESLETLEGLMSEKKGE